MRLPGLGKAEVPSVSREDLLPDVRRVQRDNRSWGSHWSSHSVRGSYESGKVRRSQGCTACSSKPASGVEQRVSSLERSRMESRQSGVRGAESSSGLMGLRGEWLWGSSECERQLPTSGDAGCGVEGFPS